MARCNTDMYKISSGYLDQGLEKSREKMRKEFDLLHKSKRY